MSNCVYTAQGDFVCNKDTIEHFGTLPVGPYKQTCINCSYNDDKELSCSCENRALKLDTYWCDMSTNDGDIIYSNKKLTCNELPFPGGSYKITCKQCTLSNNNRKVKCKCKKISGEWKTTTLENCNKNNVENNNGDLKCI